jgi:phenylalanyl-tRNA synthetase beta chain
LNKDKEYTAEELMTLYEVRYSADLYVGPLHPLTRRSALQSDRHLSRYLHIIRDSPVYPIIYDSSDGVLSMPPIINSERTKITLETTDVFIDMTAVDETKLDVVMNMVVTMFGQYCSDPFACVQDLRPSVDSFR